MQKIQRAAYLLLLSAASIFFIWILLPFYGAILWSVALAILFHPLHIALTRVLHGRQNFAAAIMVVFVISIVIAPMGLISASLGQQASALYERVQSGDIDFSLYVQRIIDALPYWMKDVLSRLGLADTAGAIRKVTHAVMQSSQHIAMSALGIGLGVVDYVVRIGVMLYLLFFLLRDGASLLTHIGAALPLRSGHRDILLSRVSSVMRATLKGGVTVAIIQGALGGLAFWYLGIPAPLLWAVIMAVFSLLPAIGAAIIWVPVAAYLLAIGNTWQGLFLLGFGILVIGLIDNFLRPFLIGKSTRLPDYVVLLSTFGGLELFGMNGLIIGPMASAIFVASWDLFRTIEGNGS